MVPVGGTPFTPLPKRTAARSFWSTATRKWRSFGPESRKLSTSVKTPCGVDTTADPSRYGPKSRNTSSPPRPRASKSWVCVFECSTTASAEGGLAPAGITTGARSWNRTGSVTSWVRVTVPAGIVTAAAGVRDSATTTPAVAACAPCSR